MFFRWRCLFWAFIITISAEKRLKTKKERKPGMDHSLRASRVWVYLFNALVK